MKRLSLKGLNISSAHKDSINSSKDNLSSNDATASAFPSSPAIETATDDDSDGTHDESQKRNSCTNDDHNTKRRSSGFFGTLNTLRRKLNIRKKSNRTLGCNSVVVSGSTSNVSCNNGCMHSTSPPRRRTLQRLRNGEKSQHTTALDWPIRAAHSDNTLNVDVAHGHCTKCSRSSKPVGLPTGRGVKGSSKQMLLVDTEYGHASAPVASQTNETPRTSDRETLHSDKLADWNLDKYEAYGSGPLETALHALQPVYDQVKDSGASSAGRPGDSGWSLTRELVKLSNFGWYWGPITRVEAEEKLSGQADGAFLVRDSSDARYLLSLSFRSYGHTLHTRIEHCNGVFSFYSQPESDGYGAIVDLIEHSMNDSRAGVFCYSRARMAGSPSIPVRLTRPVSRFAQVRTLQYLCRFVIRQYTRLDHIQSLPLPGSIKGWLEENQY